MNIDNLPLRKTITEPTLYSGKRYCIVDWDGYPSIGDPYGGGYIDWKNRISVMWTKKELDEFRKGDSVHRFMNQLREERKKEIERLTKKVKYAKTYYKSKYSGEVCNPKQILTDRLEHLKANDVRFVELTFENPIKIYN